MASTSLELIARLEAAWRAKRPELLRRAAPPATDAALTALEKLAGSSLPPAFRDLYLWHAGSKDGNLAVEGFYGWCTPTGIRRAKKLLDGMERDGFFPDWRPGSWWNAGWLPFMVFNNEEYVCIDLPGTLGVGPGAVFIRRNADPSRVVLAPSFESWLEAHVELTESGPDGADEDAWIDHFTSAKATALRRRIAPGFPRKVSAKRAKR